MSLEVSFILGKVTHSGTYEQMKNTESEFTKLLAEKKEENHEEETAIPSEKVKVKVVDEKQPKQEKEHRAVGVISKHVYKSYFRAAGNILKTVFLFSAFLLSQCFGSATDYFVSIW